MSQNFIKLSFRTYSIDQIYLKALQRLRCIENAVKYCYLAAYRLKAETKIFRLNVSFIRILYVKEEWIGRKVYYRKVYYRKI